MSIMLSGSSGLRVTFVLGIVYDGVTNVEFQPYHSRNMSCVGGPRSGGQGLNEDGSDKSYDTQGITLTCRFAASYSPSSHVLYHPFQASTVGTKTTGFLP